MPVAGDDVYNPLEKRHLAESIVRALLQRQSLPLGQIRSTPPLDGAGVYVVYYHGSFPPYRTTAEAKMPIYVGKAVPKGSRRGTKRGFDEAIGPVLYGRLREHAESIGAAAHLDLADFTCRHLVVEEIFIALAESLLINLFEPIWNIELPGFGNHDPGGGRYNQQRSHWDTVHPGRPWASKCKPNKNERKILTQWGGGGASPE